MRHISALRLTDFRNYHSLDVTFGPEPVVLFGPNGAGKTNLLEALSFLSPGRGMRRAKIEDLAKRTINSQAVAWGINATLNNETKISIGQIPEYPRRRLVRLNGANATSTELAQEINLMWLTPVQDRLFTGPAGDRRKFLDRFVFAHVPGHGAISSRYEKARSERNRLLSDGVQDTRWFEALETDLAIYGSQIAEARAATLTALQAEISARDSVFPKAQISIEGHYETLSLKGMDTQGVQNALKEDLAKGRSLAQRAGRTLIGPHRSDLCVTHIAKSMPASDCSTGEQKALLIGLMLAQARTHNGPTIKSRKPILLLDEVAAHLDEGRRAALIEELLALETQVFMTGTDESLFKAFDGRSQNFEVKDGHVQSVNS
ncbi:DNA replication and repair protein RecF [Litorimonas taeanensis]|uniref:DNA replication and repair protein RecF n=1 Tax=Litorimonas taeanensis TaxID=568099 RepID=A0A420WEQ6_9PROT|nr:DNA replication/repair protein RecF [Litorimonas taeanensis]RKQ69458.1 DNA replication and repair protein RecF [Litorimonas taeanensis]